jgi:imidazole glycerol-phosphate synthase subunit HisH
MIGIVDYGMGNLGSVRNAIASTGADVRVCTEAADLRHVDRIVLPGVGAFRDCLATLRATGFADALEARVRGDGVPILGICLGMQAMARRSLEGGAFEGLGWFDADVVRLDPASGERVPHVGWNQVHYRRDSPLFKGLPASPDFYFVHSYHVVCHDAADVDATCDYGEPVSAALRRGNIMATQFHPEKSQDFGLRVLGNFLAWTP